jgi:hypothetical protein
MGKSNLFRCKARSPQALPVLPAHSTHAGARNANQQATVIINAHL